MPFSQPLPPSTSTTPLLTPCLRTLQSPNSKLFDFVAPPVYNLRTSLDTGIISGIALEVGQFLPFQWQVLDSQGQFVGKPDRAIIRAFKVSVPSAKRAFKAQPFGAKGYGLEIAWTGRTLCPYADHLFWYESFPPEKPSLKLHFSAEKKAYFVNVKLPKGRNGPEGCYFVSQNGGGRRHRQRDDKRACFAYSSRGFLLQWVRVQLLSHQFLASKCLQDEHNSPSTKPISCYVHDLLLHAYPTLLVIMPPLATASSLAVPLQARLFWKGQLQAVAGVRVFHLE